MWNYALYAIRPAPLRGIARLDQGTCTDVRQMCAVRTVNKVFEGTTIDLGTE